MRVCHIIGLYRPVIGGAERATETLTSALAREGLDVIVLTRRSDRAHASQEVIGGVPVYRLNPRCLAITSFLFGAANP